MFSRAILVVSLVLVGCSKPPAMPRLPQNEPTVDSIVLKSQLSVSDVRRIFRDINRNGRLDGLKPYLEQPSDSALAPLVGVVNRQIYRELDSADGLVAAIEAASGEGAFRRLARSAADAAAREGYGDRAELMLSALGDARFPKLAQRDRRWLEPALTGMLAEAWNASAAEYRERVKHPEAPAFPTAALDADLRRVLGQAESRRALGDRLEAFVQSGFVRPLLQAGATLRARAGSRAFESFGWGLAAFLHEPSKSGAYGRLNEADRILDFLVAANAPSGGVFSTLSDGFRRERDALEKAAVALQPLFPRSVLVFLKDRLSTSPKFGKDFWMGMAPTAQGTAGPSFKPFARAAREAVEALVGKARDEKTADEFLFNLPIHVNSYALARWAEQIAVANSADWKKLPAQGFEKTIWAQPVKVPAVAIALAKDGGALDERLEKDWKNSDLEPTGDEIKALAQRGGYGDFQYAFDAKPSATLEAATGEALAAIDRTRRFGSAFSAVEVFVAQITRPGSDGKSLLDRLESDNLMHALHAVLAGLGPDAWQLLRGWIFEGLTLGTLPAETRDMLLKFYADRPELKAKVARVLEALPALYRFSQPAGELPPPFGVYHQILIESGRASREAFGAGLAYLGEQGFLSETVEADGQRHPRFPGFFTWLSNGARTGRFFDSLARIPGAEYPRLELAIAEMLGGDGVRSHLDFAADLVARNPRGLAAWLNVGSAEGFEVPGGLRRWLLRFLGTPDFPELCEFLREHADRASLLQFIRELKRLDATGELTEAFQLLSYLRDDRLHDLGRFFLRWQKSGELRSFLDGWEALLAPVVPVST